MGWEALLSLGVDDPGNHMVVLQDWPNQGDQVSMTDPPEGSGNQPREDMLLLKRSPWTTQDVDRVERVCADQTWEIRYAPDHPNSDSEFALLLDPKTHDAFVEGYGQNVSPTTDNNPHFFQEERPEVLLGRIWKIGQGFGSGSSGTNTLIAAALSLTLLGLLVVLVHFWSLRREPKSAGVYRLTIFNALLGLGFMFVASWAGHGQPHSFFRAHFPCVDPGTGSWLLCFQNYPRPFSSSELGRVCDSSGNRLLTDLGRFG